MTRVSVSEKLSVAIAVLLEKGPMSISSLAEEVAKIIGGKVTTTRSQLSVAVNELIESGVLMDVGSDKYGSRLVDISPKGVEILLTLLASGYDYRYFKWDILIKYFERRLPHLVNYVRLLKILVEEWTRVTIGQVSEEEMSDFIEDLAFALAMESQIGRKHRIKITLEDIPTTLEQLILGALETCKNACDLNRILENLKKEGLTDILKDIARKEVEARKVLKTLLKLL